jgi:phosphate:Na+ symporter
MLKPSSFAPILAMTGVVFIMTGRREKMKEIGESLIGFSLLMFGMQTMSGAVEALADDPSFTGILTMFKNPIAGIMAGAILTAVIQSSSASIGILQALSVTGAFTYGSVIPIIMGQNIGTCATALLSSIGAGKGAKQAALVHLYFNLIGSVIFMLTYYLFDIIFIFSFTDKTAGIAGIAAIHTIFNVFATVSLLPFAGALERLVKQ